MTFINFVSYQQGFIFKSLRFCWCSGQQISLLSGRSPVRAQVTPVFFFNFFFFFGGLILIPFEPFKKLDIKAKKPIWILKKIQNFFCLHLPGFNLANNYFSTIFEFLEPTTPIRYPYRALGMILIIKKNCKKKIVPQGARTCDPLYTNCGQISKHTMKIRHKMACTIFSCGLFGHFETFSRTA